MPTTPSSPAPSKTSNQSRAIAGSVVDGREVDRLGWVGDDPLEARPALGERALAEVVVAIGEAVEGDERGRRFRGEHPDARLGRMDADEQRVEVEAALGTGDDDLAVERRTARRAAQGQERRVELGEVAVQRLEVARLEVDRRPVAEDEGAEAVPLRLVRPAVAGRDLGVGLASIGSSGGSNGKAMRR